MICNNCEHCVVMPNVYASYPQAMIAKCSHVDLDSNAPTFVPPREIRFYAPHTVMESPEWCPLGPLSELPEPIELVSSVPVQLELF